MFTKKRIILIIIGLLTVTAGSLLWLYFNNIEQRLEVNYLDIGQGDGVLIRTPYDQNILIDGGDVDSGILRQLPKFMPFYDRTIDLMIVSHPHDDHVGGLVKVVKRYNVKNILYTGVAHYSPTYLAWLDDVRSRDIAVTIIERPQDIILGDDLVLKILYPLKSFVNKEVDNINNSSIVAQLVYRDKKFLFTGDIEIEVEAELVEAQADLDSDIYLAGHHGSDTSSTLGFLELVTPDITVIQVGKDNDFGHPSLRVLRRLERLDSIYYRNDLDGWVQVSSNGYDIEAISANNR